MNRRQFLGTASAAGAMGGWQLVAARVLGGDGRVAPSNRVAIGVIGLGIQGVGDMKSFLGMREARVLAVCDVHEGQRAKGKQVVDTFYGNSDCAAYNDFRELIARPDIDAVQITAPDHWHPLIAIEAARHGKHMYQEKPMGWSVRAAHAVEKAVKENEVVFQFGTQQRSDGKFRFACELVRNGRIGRLKTILVGVPGSVSSCPIQPAEPVPKELDYDLWLGPAPMAPYSYQRCRPYSQKEGWSVWYGISDYCMGMIGNWGVHHLDIAQWGNNTELTGPVEIEGLGQFPKGLLTDCAVSWQVENRYANGVTLIHMDDATSRKHPLQQGGHGHGVMFLGTEGWVHVDRQKLDAQPASLLETKFGPDEPRLLRSDNHGANFIGAVKGRNQPAAPIAVAVRTDTLCNLQLIAATLKRKLRWDPDQERFLDDAEANSMLDRPMRAPWRL
ncbi:MAG TPA: Gfo/Idh/MocA family oxidoreductase [Candidatus Paceibacterota bacterium]|nr:Gfo/Idh/MocA family oxidoreductase [Verrucomicrobiota bacterium]HRZ47508.1 Gfo/Idh/MocA family oxidoreductase [Candidatus Paceibacterota bacterium]